MPVLLMIAGFSCFIAGMTMHGELDWFTDGPSFVVVLLPAVLFTCAFHSVSGLRLAVTTALGDGDISLRDAHSHLTVLKSLRSLLWASSAIGFLIGVVLILVLIEDIQSVTRAVAVALLCLLYGSMLAELFVNPLTHRLERRVVTTTSAS